MLLKEKTRKEALEQRLKYLQTEEDANAVLEHLLFLLEDLKKQGLTLALYTSFKNELDILSKASMFAKYFSLCLPEVKEKDKPLSFNKFSPKNSQIKKDIFGISTSCGTDVVPDILLIPLVAFNRQGVRLGYGGGYYDRTCNLNPNFIKIGVGFSFQEREDIQRQEHDQLLDYVVTEKEIIKCQ